MSTQLQERPARQGRDAMPHVQGLPPAYDAERLRRLLAARTLKRGDFLLASGRRSRFYVNVKTTMMHPDGAALCARGLIEKLADLRADYIGGLEMGAVPLLSVVSAFSAELGTPLPSFFVRKTPKPHGTQLLIEGMDDMSGETLQGKHVVLVDDVATTGGSILRAVEQIANAGGTMSDAIVILDREEGAEAVLREHDIKLHALFTATAVGVTAQDREPYN